MPAALEMAGVAQLGKRYPAQLSGGQQQRVALARAVVGRDGLVLFDEPLSKVDAHIRETLRAELVQLQQEIAFSAIYVTHDQIEAAALADRIAIMSQGVIEQVGTPHLLYTAPATAYVAEFFGTTNSLNATVTELQGGFARLQTEAGEIFAPAEGFTLGAKVKALFRLENVLLEDPGSGFEGAVLSGTAARTSFLGFYSDAYIRCSGAKVLVRTVGRPLPEAGTPTALYLPARSVRLFAAE